MLLISSCKKNSGTSDFLWEESYGAGTAYSIDLLTDSGFIASGRLEGKPFFIRLDKKFGKIVEIKKDVPGLFSSVWTDNSGYLAGGNTSGKMLLVRYSKSGNELWEKTMEADFPIDLTHIYYKGSGEMLAIGTTSPDSLNAGVSGIYFLRLDTSGQVLDQNIAVASAFVAANRAAVDNNGNIYVALTRKEEDSKPRASVAKYNSLFQMLWETELYNNPDFGAAARSVLTDLSGNIYVTGNTELSASDGILDNSFVVSLTTDGIIRNNWKKYLENNNEGAALLFDNNNELMVLNKNCYIVNILNPADGTEDGRIRMFSLCSPGDTDALGEDFTLNYDKNILIAGSLAGSFFIAMKSLQ